MIRPLHCLFTLAICASSGARAQVVETSSTTIPASFGSYLTLYEEHVDADGAVVAVGVRADSSMMGFSLRFGSITRIDASGQTLWTRESAPPTDVGDWYHRVDPDEAGGWYVTGSRRIAPTSLEDVLAARYDGAGTLLWTSTFGAPSWNERAVASATQAQGGIWIVGSTGPSPSSTVGDDVLVVRFTAGGALAASNAWNGPTGKGDFAVAVHEDGAGGVYVAGTTNAFATSGDPLAESRVFVLRVDALGTVIWSTLLGAPGSWASALEVGPDGRVYVACTLNDGIRRFGLLALNAQGQGLWARTYVDPATPYGDATDLAVDARGDVVVVGDVRPFAANAYRSMLVQKYDPSGGLAWSHYWQPANSYARAYDLALDGGGGVYVAGSVGGQGAPASGGLVLRFDRDGTIDWTHVSSAQIPATIGTNGSGAVVVAGSGPNLEARVLRLDETSVPICFGDGSSTPCPCGNASPASERAGCTNSFATAGRLDARGASSLTGDTLVLQGSGMTNSNALYIQGDASGTASVFGDGLRCVSGNVVRLGTRTNVAGASSWPGVGDPSVSVRGGVVAPGVRTYQAWYRNVASFCTPAAFNLTNGVRVTWTS